MSYCFQIIVPIYNEAVVLPKVLQFACDARYLEHIVFVDDASTDASPQILQDWRVSHGIRVILLKENRKKEGAIREVLEVLESQGTLEPYTVLLDADSFITCPKDEMFVLSLLQNAISTMRDRGLSGMAFRIDAAIDNSSNLLERCAFADYSAMQFDQWLTSHQGQLWVINGPGGLFRSGLLLSTLRDMQPDFETGDLLITVKLMKNGLGVAYYPKIQVKTFVPRTFWAYFNQRRRWERGTMKVLWWERGFYVGIFKPPKILAIQMLIHLSIYIGILSFALSIVLTSDHFSIMVKWLSITYLTWLAINLMKGLWNKHIRTEGHASRYALYCLINGILWLVVTTWARFVGFIDAILYFFNTVKVPHKTAIQKSVLTAPGVTTAPPWPAKDAADI